MKKKLGLLYGGKSAEHDVSLSTAKAVIQALHFDQYDVFPIFITRDGEWRRGAQLASPVESISELQFGQNSKETKPNDISSFLLEENEKPFDVIFPLLHGTNGEDGTVQGLLRSIKFTVCRKWCVSISCWNG